MATTRQLRQRQATPERWQSTLGRAIANGVEVRQLAGTGQWIVTSSSDASVAYGTDGLTCECAAAMLGADPVCQHRAMFWHALGVLDLNPEPEPPASAAPRVIAFPRVVAHACALCDGRGFDPACSGHKTAAGWILCECPACDGSGHQPGKEEPAPLAA